MAECHVSLALIYLAISLPISLLIKESPWREEARKDEVEEERNFPLSETAVVVWISLAVIFCCVCMSVPIMHLVPLLTDKGFSLEFSTFVLMLLMICGLSEESSVVCLEIILRLCLVIS